MLFNRRLNKDITYWASPVINSTGGISFASPVTIKGRWEDRQEEFRTDTGDEFVSKSTVWVLQELDIGGYLYDGVSAASDPTALDGAFKIQKLISIPDLRNLGVERRAIL